MPSRAYRRLIHRVQANPGGVLRPQPRETTTMPDREMEYVIIDVNGKDTGRAGGSRGAPPHLKTVHVPRGYTGLHCEVPGCIVNIRVALEDDAGRAVTSIQIQPDQYTGEAPWYVLVPTAVGGTVRSDGATLRVRQEERSARPDRRHTI